MEWRRTSLSCEVVLVSTVMRHIYSLVLALVAFPLVLCGCGGGGGDSCGAIPTCGGALDGTWRLTGATCVEGDLDAALLAQAKSDDPSFPSECNNMFQGFTLDASGTANFASNVETDNITLTMRGHAVYSQACMSGMADSSVTLTSAMCSSVQSGLLEQGDLGVEAIALSRKAHAVDGAIDGKTAHMGEHEVGEGNDVKRGSLGVLGPRRGQRDGEWGARHGGRAEHRADLVEG